MQFQELIHTRDVDALHKFRDRLSARGLETRIDRCRNTGTHYLNVVCDNKKAFSIMQEWNDFADIHDDDEGTEFNGAWELNR